MITFIHAYPFIYHIYTKPITTECVWVCSPWRTPHYAMPSYAHPGPVHCLSDGSGRTLFSLLISLLHGHKGREMRLIVGKNQR